MVRGGTAAPSARLGTYMQTDLTKFTFDDCSLADANRLARSLADALRDIDPNIVVDRQQDLPHTQDLGASPVVMLGTSAVTAVAKGMGPWLARNSDARIQVRRNGKIVLTATHLDIGIEARTLVLATKSDITAILLSSEKSGRS